VGAEVKLVASAIVRNEAGRYLETWLRHLLTFCDEVRLLDDGSSDETVEIALAYEPEVKITARAGRSFLSYESEARNELLRWTMGAEPSYVLSIDADEFIGDAGMVREAALSGAPVCALWMREVWKVSGDELGLRVDGQWGDRRCPLLWQAPDRLRGGRWQIPRRRLACGREPLAVRSQKGVDTGVGIYHFGWTREADRVARADRYFQHDRGRFHADKHLQSILWPDTQVRLRWVPWPPSIPEAVADVALAA
jgi:glycosyltransferase involved in cell wall biosynthesis